MSRIDPHNATSIVLMGLRGSGKSTLGRDLAGRLGRPFVDLDDRSPALLGSPTAAEAINTHGLAAFREAERDALEDVLSEARIEPVVLALGGGTPTAEGAGALLQLASGSGLISLVYLHAPPAELRRRLSSTDTASRPSLTGAGMLDEIETVYLQRDELYRELATVIIETEDADRDQLAEAIIVLLGADPG